MCDARRLLVPSSALVLLLLASSIASGQGDGDRDREADQRESSPLGRGIEWLLEGDWLKEPRAVRDPTVQRRPPGRDRGRGGTPPTEEKSAQPQLDESLNCDVAPLRALQQIEEFVARERWPEVVAALQGVLEGQLTLGDTFGMEAEGRWVSAQLLAQRRIAQLPSAALTLYRDVYGPVANELLAQARRTGDVERLADLARRYRNTDAGEEAALEIALLHYDRAEFVAAARWFERVSDERLRRGNSRLRARLAETLWRTGRRADAEKILSELTAPPDAHGESVRLAQSVRQALTSADSSGSHDPLPKADWLMPYGDAAHSAVAVARQPLLTAAWERPLTHIPAVRTQLQHVHSDLRESGRACVPANFSVVVGNYVAVRTLRGVEVYRLQDGRVLWTESLAEDCPDRLLSGTITGTGDELVARQNTVNLSRYGDSGDADQHPLTSLLYRDSVYGALSTDGRQLFVVAQHAVMGRANRGYVLGTQPEPLDPFGRDWSANAIRSYDIETGQVRWQIGGPSTGEPFDRPLAGTYFFGPPTVAGDELYVIGERENQISLFALERTTGQPVFVQPLANSQSPIGVDATRRMWGCFPAVADGVVICPTTVGWTVAVDRLEQRLLWAYSSQGNSNNDRRMRFGGTMVEPLQPLNTRWMSTPPIVSGRYVLLTPTELPDATYSREPFVVCLDRTTGREVWRRAKENDGLYVSCVAKGRVLVVGNGRVRALRLDNGGESWSATLPVDTPPSGRGIICEDEFLLPLASGDLWSIRISDGEVTNVVRSLERGRVLGNLLMSSAGLISIDHLAARRFSDSRELEAHIAARTAVDPGDVWSAIRRAEISWMHGDEEAAVADLCAVSSNQLAAVQDGKVADEYRRAMRRMLSEVIAADFFRHDREFELLSAQVDWRTDPALRRLAVDRALARGEIAAAWRMLWPPPSEASNGSAVVDRQLSVAVWAWERGRLAEAYRRASQELRVLMDAAFSEAAANAVESENDARSRDLLESLLSFHSAGRGIASQRATQSVEAGDLGSAEIRWRRLLDSPHPPEVVAGGLQLTQLYLEQSRWRDAAIALRATETRMGDNQSDLPAAVRATWDKLTDRMAAAAEDATASHADWAANEFAAMPKRNRQHPATPQEVLIAPGSEPFYTDHHFEFQTSSQRLRVRTVQGEEFWSLPLRMANDQRAIYGQTVGLRTDGLQAYSIWQGSVQALSFVDRSVRWDYPIEIRMSGAGYIRNSELEANSTMLPTDQFSRQSGLKRYRSPTGMVAAANAHHVVLHGRRRITVLDALTGQVRWTRSGLSPRTMVYSDRDRIYCFPSNGSHSFALSAVDGRELSLPSLGRHGGTEVALESGVLTRAEVLPTVRIFGLATPKVRFTGIDVSTGETRWQQDIQQRTRIARLGRTELLLLPPDGETTALDLATGESRDLGNVPAKLAQNAAPVQVLQDADAIYLLFDREWTRQSHYVTQPHLQINGEIVCVDRSGNGVKWRRKIEEQLLITSRFPQLPVLLFFNQAGDSEFHRLFIEMWDKKTGRPLLQSSDLLVNPQTYQLQFDFARRTISFLGHSLLIQIAPNLSPDRAAQAESDADASPDDAPQ